MKIRLLHGRVEISWFALPAAALGIYLFGWAGIAGFFAAMALHEFAHAYAARVCGVVVSRFEVQPFGCCAQIEATAPPGAGKEIVMAAAGPLSNIVAGAAVVLFSPPGGEFSNAFYESNLMLAAFNLIPALPLDGGRILLAVLSRAIPTAKAQRIASALGAAVACVMLAGGVVMALLKTAAPMLFVMSAFLLAAAISSYKNAGQEQLVRFLKKRSALERRSVLEVRPLAAHAGRRGAEVLAEMDAGRYNIVYVLDDALRVCAELDETVLAEELSRRPPGAKLSSCIQRSV